MSDRDMRNSVISKLIQALESEGTFTETVKVIMDKMQGYLKAESIILMQINQDNSTMDVLLESSFNGRAGKIGTVRMVDFTICGEDLKLILRDTSPRDEVAILDRLKAVSGITVPIRINNIIAFYLVIIFSENSQFDISFVTDAAKIIQCIAQRKVTNNSNNYNNSTFSSYEVLKDILSNIGAGIVVCSKKDGSILFENDMASGVDYVKDIIRECFEDAYKSGNIDNAVKTPVEKYSATAGLWFEVRFSVLKWIDGEDAVVMTAVDITQKKKNQQKIEYQAHNDFLTGMYNRMKCETDLRRIIKRSVREKTKGAVLFIDLDNFKHINDGLGHQYGDILLQQIAAGLSSVPKLRGHCYRMGGDEFVIIIMPENYGAIEDIINNIIAMFNKPWYLMETEYYCTMSMGIAVYPENSTDVHEIIRMADVAMYEAKKAGKNRYIYYNNNSDNGSTMKKLDIESSMRQAIATEMREFVVFYQPVFDIQTRECTSCEALVRWDSKSFGFMVPGDFIPLAEYLGLITSIGDYVLEAACIQCKKWNDNGFPDFRINVNLSVVQLLQKDVVDIVRRTLVKTGVNPKNIVLEITESFAINDMHRVLGIIEGIRALGPKIALDDFGTGYSSLNYIKQLPLDIIKVDKAFIDDIVEDDYAQAFVKLIVELSKTIGTKIVVEGVEQKEQYELLKELGVDYIQGYYFGRPVPYDVFEEINFKRRL